MNQTGSQQRPTALRRWTYRNLSASPRWLVEFSCVAAVFVLANPTKLSLIVGAIVAAFGEGWRLWAAGYGAKLDEFVLAGPYRLVRHPYYFGTLVVLVGLCLASRNVYVMAATLALLGLVFRHDAAGGEQAAKSQLGPKFSDYRAHVSAFIPQLFPVPAASDVPKFSWRVAVLTGRHRELDALVGLGVGFAVLGLMSFYAPELWMRGAVAAIAVLYLASRFIYYSVRKERTRPMASPS